MKYIITICIFLSALYCWYLPQIYYEIQGFDFSYAEDLKERTKAEEELEKYVKEILSPIVIDEKMLDWVIMCESSGRHEGIWGRQGEYGILQFKQKSFYWLSKKYNFTGDWKSKEDQIDLFLLVSEEDKYKHLSCVRKFYQLKELEKLIKEME